MMVLAVPRPGSRESRADRRGMPGWGDDGEHGLHACPGIMAARKKKSPATPSRVATPTATPVTAPPTGFRHTREPVDLSRALLNAWRVNERINQELLWLIAPHIWRVFPGSSKRRN